MEEFNVPIELIRGHEEITPRKPDPGPLFDWQRLKRALTSTTVPAADVPSRDELVDLEGQYSLLWKVQTGVKTTSIQIGD